MIENGNYFEILNILLIEVHVNVIINVFYI